VSKCVNEPSEIIHHHVSNEYGELELNNPIAKYNHDRLKYKLLKF
jgi:hypothetical protein